MADILPFLVGRTFDAETIRIMGEAFDMTSLALHESGQPPVVQELIAQRIIDIASTGVRDPDQLSQQALQALGLDA
jgi:hypothetical protein